MSNVKIVYILLLMCFWQLKERGNGFETGFDGLRLAKLPTVQKGLELTRKAGRGEAFFFGYIFSRYVILRMLYGDVQTVASEFFVIMSVCPVTLRILKSYGLLQSSLCWSVL